jgi:tetratricopeptide (TPR) repeat protein
MYNVAAVELQQADAATGAQKSTFAQKSADAWKAYLVVNPDDADGKAAMARALQLSGDTAAVSSTYKPMLANPSQYNDVQLFQAGGVAARTTHPDDADSLFRLGLAINPYYAEALHFVANDAFNNKKPDQLADLVKRALALDPNNADNYRLLAGLYQLRSHDDKTPAARRTDNDSTVFYYNKFKTMPLVVSMSKFAHASPTSIELSGTVQNRGTTPKTVTMKMQMVDKTGATVTSQDVPLTIPAGQSVPFSFTATGSGIAGYKYDYLE